MQIGNSEIIVGEYVLFSQYKPNTLLTYLNDLPELTKDEKTLLKLVYETLKNRSFWSCPLL